MVRLRLQGVDKPARENTAGSGGRWGRAMGWHGYKGMRSMGVLSPIDSVLGEGGTEGFGVLGV